MSGSGCVRGGSLRLVLALLIAAMVVTAVPAQVSAASGGLVVGSQHTDFGSGGEAAPQELSNLTVSGSGDDATVNLKDSGNGFIAYESPNNWLKYVNETGHVVNTSKKVTSVGGVGDIDGDGDADIVYRDTNDNLKYIDTNGNVVDTGAQAFTPGSVGDIDGDGDADIIYENKSGDLKHIDAAGNIGDLNQKANKIGGMGDIDGDGALEVAFTDHDLNLKYVDAAGNMVNLTQDVYSIGGVGDIDDDGDVDITHTGSASNLKYIDAAGNVVDTGQDAYSIGGVADIDGDSDLDIGYIVSNGGYVKHVDAAGNVVTTNEQAESVGGMNGSKYFSVRKYVSALHSVSNAEEATINISQANDVSINATVRTDSGTVLNQTTLTTTGNHTLTLADTSSDKLEVVLNISVTGDNPQFELGDESILFDNDAPVVDNNSASPSGGEKLTTKGATLSIDVNDSQFGSAQGESLTVEFQTKGPDDSSFSTVATKTLNSNGTPSTSLSGLVGGTHQWRVIVTDDYGAQTTSKTFSFKVPDQLFIRNVSNTSEKITSTAQVTFYGDSSIVKNSTNDGSVNLTGKPVGETMVVEVSATDYHTRTTIIESIYQQQTIYMLNKSVASVEVRFVLEDNTGDFDTDSTYVMIERPLTENGETNWVTVTGDFFGVNGFTTDLEDGQKYRIRIKNGQGDERVLGTYTASASETVTLTVGEVTSLPEGCDCSMTQNATYDDDGSTTYVRYSYNDTLNQTSELHVKIYEKGNESNVLFPNTTYTNLGTVAIVEAVPQSENSTTWAVDVVGTRNGEQFVFKTYVGPRNPVLPSLPGWVKALISIGSIWIVAGLFSQLNGSVGAVATAGLGGMWWFVDFLPRETGIGVVVLALITAGILMVHSQRGGT